MNLRAYGQIPLVVFNLARLVSESTRRSLTRGAVTSSALAAVTSCGVGDTHCAPPNADHPRRELVSELLHIGGDLGGQRHGRHLPGTIADNLIQQRPAATPVSSLASSAS